MLEKTRKRLERKTKEHLEDICVAWTDEKISDFVYLLGSMEEADLIRVTIKNK